MQLGQRLQLRWSRRKITVPGIGSEVREEPIRGTVTGFRARGVFQVTFDSVDRAPGKPRSRFWYQPDQVSGFELL